MPWLQGPRQRTHFFDVQRGGSIQSPVRSAQAGDTGSIESVLVTVAELEIAKQHLDVGHVLVRKFHDLHLLQKEFGKWKRWTVEFEAPSKIDVMTEINCIIHH